MRCLFAGLAIGTLALAGCQATSAMTDPFAAARVPPPPIGQVTAPPVPYGATAPPAVSLPAGAPYTAPPGTPSYGPPSGPPPGAQGLPPPPAGQPYTSPGPISPTGANRAQPGGGWVPAATTAGGPTPESSRYPNGPTPTSRPLDQAATGASLAHAASDVPGGSNVPGQENLQPITQLQQVPVAQPLRDPRGVSGVQPASYQIPADNPDTVSHSVYARDQAAATGAAATGAAAQYRPGSTAAAPRAAAKGPIDQGATYGFDGNYAWLHGRLEYSEASRTWKLRYVPIDGPTDRFGGSVVLADSDLLAGHKAGEFVAVKGQMDGRPGPQGSFAPLYRVTEVQSLSN